MYGMRPRIRGIKVKPDLWSLEDGFAGQISLGTDVFTTAEFSSGLTLEVAFNPYAAFVNRYMLSFENMLRFRTTTVGPLAFMVNDGALHEIMGDENLVAGRWYVAFGIWNRDGDGLVRMNINGVEQSSTLASGAPNFDGFSRDSRIFSHFDGTWKFSGLIAYVRLYNVAFHQHEIEYNILNPYNPIRDNLRLWLQIEEGNGLTVYDWSGLGRNGTMTGTIPWVRNVRERLLAEVLA